MAFFAKWLTKEHIEKYYLMALQQVEAKLLELHVNNLLNDGEVLKQEAIQREITELQLSLVNLENDRLETLQNLETKK